MSEYDQTEIDDNYCLIRAVKLFKNILTDCDQIVIGMNNDINLIIRNCQNKKRNRKQTSFLELKENEK